MITVFILDALLIFLEPMPRGIPIESRREVQGIFRSEKDCMLEVYEHVDWMKDINNATLIETIPRKPCQAVRVKASAVKNFTR